MDRTGKKYKARNKKSAQARAEYIYGKLCAVCRCHPATECHHLAGRNAKARDEVAAQYEHPANWLPVCGSFGRGCHEMVDKETPALMACAAKLEMGELDIRHLQKLKAGRKFAINLSELHQALDDLQTWRLK